MTLKRTALTVMLSALVLGCIPGRQTEGVQRRMPADWIAPFKPFRIIGNINYVGTKGLACFLITTPAGHILIDTALGETVPIVKGNIEALGFQTVGYKNHSLGACAF